MLCVSSMYDSVSKNLQLFYRCNYCVVRLVDICLVKNLHLINSVYARTWIQGKLQVVMGEIIRTFSTLLRWKCTSLMTSRNIVEDKA